MSTLTERIASVVEDSKLSKTKFAEKIGISQPYLSQICSGAKVPSDRTISDICREFCINGKWLRTGEGFRKPVELDEETAVIEKFLDDIDDPVRSIVTAIIKTYMASDPGDKDAIKEFASKLLDSKK